MYFRELPNPLLTYQLYDKFAVSKMKKSGINIIRVKEKIWNFVQHCVFTYPEKKKSWSIDT